MKYMNDMITKEQVENAWKEYYDFRHSEFGGPGNGCDDYRDYSPEVSSKMMKLYKSAQDLQKRYNESQHYVDNDVWKYSCSLKCELSNKNIVVYTKPFPHPIIVDENEYDKECKRRENLIQDKYFTKERIEEIKQEFINRIQECENPFQIYCVDTDGGYNVTEDELFKINE